MKFNQWFLLVIGIVGALIIGIMAGCGSEYAQDSYEHNLRVAKNQGYKISKYDDETGERANAWRRYFNERGVKTMKEGNNNDDGRVGPSGLPGLDGQRGDTGERGEQGSAGQDGQSGEQGAAGADGERGAQGETGERGEQGIQGEQGAQGIQGDRGVRGPRGRSGADGEDGEDGLTCEFYQVRRNKVLLRCSDGYQVLLFGRVYGCDDEECEEDDD